MIREAHINDCPRMAEIHVFGWRSAFKGFISGEYLINKMTVKTREESFRQYLLNTEVKDKTYIYEEDSIIKGFLTIGDCRDDDKNEETFELMGIYVEPLFQRQKIGTKLTDYCIEEARKQNKKEITLWVFEKNEDSIRFYEEMGFKIDGKVKMMERYNENAIILRMGL